VVYLPVPRQGGGEEEKEGAGLGEFTMRNLLHPPLDCFVSTRNKKGN